MEIGDYQQAVSYYKEALTLNLESGNERYIAESLEQLANAAVMHQQSDHAARLLGAAEAMRQSSGFALFPYQIANYERMLEALRSQLDEATFQILWAEGRAMNVKQAVEYAMGENVCPTFPPAPSPSSSPT